MRLFDHWQLFGGDSAANDGRVTEASHILLTGPNANAECEQMKVQIYKDALGWFGKAEDGVEPDKLIKAFGNKARAKSTCPSKAQGGSLGYCKINVISSPFYLLANASKAFFFAA